MLSFRSRTGPSTENDWHSNEAKGYTITVTGTVTDDLETPPCVEQMWIEKGTTNGTQTDFDGNYTLNVNSGATLVFSYFRLSKKRSSCQSA
jgi:hypothetical protein